MKTGVFLLKFEFTDEDIERYAALKAAVEILGVAPPRKRKEQG